MPLYFKYQISYVKIMKNVLNGRAKRSDIEALYKKGYNDSRAALSFI